MAIGERALAAQRSLFESIWAKRIAALVGCLAILVYLSPHLTIGPNHVDEALNLELIHLTGRGQRLHFDFIDAYGPLHHLGPALAWRLAGETTWGVRIWILLVKVVSIGLTFGFVARMSDRPTAWLATLWLTVLLGLPWQALQSPYAFFHALPLLLGAYWLLVERGPARNLRFCIAGVLTAAAVYVKVNAGAFLFAGGLLFSIYWLPGDCRPSSPATHSKASARLFRGAQLVGLALFGVVFLTFTHDKIDPLFYLYFDVPLLIALGWTLKQVLSEARNGEAFRHRVRATFVYAGSTLCSVLAFLLAYFGVEAGRDYVEEMFTMLATIRYEHPVLPIGKAGYYFGFTDYYWMQVPWLSTLLFVIWIRFQRDGRGARTFGASWPERRAVTTGLWVFATLGIFVVFQVGQEVHMVSAILPATPALFVLLHDLRRMAEQTAEDLGKPSLRRLPAPVLTGMLVLWLSTITFPPSLASIAWGKGEWTVRPGRTGQQNRFARLEFAQHPHPGYAEFWPDVPDREWDKALNQAAMLVDDLTEDGEEVLTLSSEQLVAFHGFASDVGGRYRFLFYLLRNRLLDRDGFDRIAPPDLIPRLVENPPRVVVTTTGWMPTLLTIFPELQSIGKRYRVVGQFRRILVLARNDVMYKPPGVLSRVQTTETTKTSSSDRP